MKRQRQRIPLLYVQVFYLLHHLLTTTTCEAAAAGGALLVVSSGRFSRTETTTSATSAAAAWHHRRLQQQQRRQQQQLFPTTPSSSTLSSFCSLHLSSHTRGQKGTSDNSNSTPNQKNQQQPKQQKRSKAVFAQPAFAMNDSVTNKLSHRHSIHKQSDSHLTDLHNVRVRTAGRVGTKHYVNPCKVFIGNLSYTVTEKQLQEWLCTKMGVPVPVLLNEVKIIHDWKTKRSKGYAFVVFTEAVYATVCIDTLNGREMQGRILTVNQGVKKQPETVVYMDNKKSTQAGNPVDEDEVAIQSGLKEAMIPASQPQNRMDPEEAAILQCLDPDLVKDDDADEVGDLIINNGKKLDDAVLFGDDHDENAGIDAMNRQQRRQAARKRPRRKLPRKGFGNSQ